MTLMADRWSLCCGVDWTLAFDQNKEYTSVQSYFNPTSPNGVPCVKPWPWVRVCLCFSQEEFFNDQQVTSLDWCRMTQQFLVKKKKKHVYTDLQVFFFFQNHTQIKQNQISFHVNIFVSGHWPHTTSSDWWFPSIKILVYCVRTNRHRRGCDRLGGKSVLFF